MKKPTTTETASPSADPESPKFADTVYLKSPSLHQRMTDGRYRVEVDEHGMGLSRLADHPRDGSAHARLPKEVADRVRTMRAFLNSMGGKSLLRDPSAKATFEMALHYMIMSYPIPSRAGVASRQGRTPEDANMFIDVEVAPADPSEDSAA